MNSTFEDGIKLVPHKKKLRKGWNEFFSKYHEVFFYYLAKNYTNPDKSLIESSIPLNPINNVNLNKNSYNYT